MPMQFVRQIRIDQLQPVELALADRRVRYEFLPEPASVPIGQHGQLAEINVSRAAAAVVLGVLSLDADDLAGPVILDGAGDGAFDQGDVLFPHGCQAELLDEASMVETSAFWSSEEWLFFRCTNTGILAVKGTTTATSSHPIIITCCVGWIRDVHFCPVIDDFVSLDPDGTNVFQTLS